AGPGGRQGGPRAPPGAGHGGMPPRSSSALGGGTLARVPLAPREPALAAHGKSLRPASRQGARAPRPASRQSRGGWRAGEALPDARAGSAGGARPGLLPRPFLQDVPSLGRAARAGGEPGAPVATPAITPDVPHEFLCPISQEIMRDAVSTCDGHTYERRSIEEWLEERTTSPVTGLPLANNGLIPNHNLRKLIRDSGLLPAPDPCAALASLGWLSGGAGSVRFRREVCWELVVPRDAATCLA
ncbi:unnamed protein product, partial [Prorocentrum cordatum]